MHIWRGCKSVVAAAAAEDEEEEEAAAERIGRRRGSDYTDLCPGKAEGAMCNRRSYCPQSKGF